MNLSFFKRIGISFIAMLFSLSINAEPVQPSGETFQTVCTDAWMKKADDASDKVEYKNFGEKYCGCAANQPLDNDAAIQKAIHLCMSRTLLHDAMDSVEDDVGLSDAKDTDIATYCQNKWNLVYPKQTDEDKKLTAAYCECAKPKLVDLLKQADSMTDKQYYDGIDGIAAACSDNALAVKPTTAN